MFDKSVRYRLESVMARALLAVFKAMPLDVASGIGGWLGRTFGPHLKASRTARRNLSRAMPHLTPDEQTAIVRQSWDNLGRVMAEFPHLAQIARQRVELVNGEVFDTVRDDGKPGIFVSGHLGNWEVAGALVCNRQIPLTLVYRAANNPLVNALFLHHRAPAATGGQIPKGPDGARAILSVLKNGGHIAMLVDQKMNDGIEVPFFGLPAMTAPAASRFAVRFRCPVIPARVERLSGANFRLTVYEPIHIVPSQDAHQDNLDLMIRLNQLLEQWIRETPGQWLWMHKRWPSE